MKKRVVTGLDRVFGTMLLVACFFGNFAPFLDVDLKVITLTPLRWMALIVCGYCALGWLKKWRDIPAWIRQNKARSAMLLFFCVWAICGVVWLIATDRNATASTEVMGIITLCMYAFAFFTLIRDRDDVEYYLNVCLSSGIVMALLGVLEIVTGSLVEGTSFHYSLQELMSLGKTLFPPTVVFHNTNDLATFLLMCLAIDAYRFIQAKTDREMLLCAGVALVLLAPTPIINSTIFELAFLLLMTVTVVAVFLMRGKQISWRFRRCVGAVLLVLVYFIPFTALMQSSAKWLNTAYFTNRIEQWVQMQASGNVQNPDQGPDSENTNPDEELDDPDLLETNPEETVQINNDEKEDSFATQLEAARNGYGTIHIRLWQMKSGWQFFLEKPILGWGPGGYRDKIQENRALYLEVRGYVDPHNFYVELLVQYGGLFFLAYMLILLPLIFITMKRAVEELWQARAGSGVSGVLLLAGFSVAAIMPSSIIRLTPLWIFFLLGICMADQKE